MTRTFVFDSDSRAIDGRIARLEIEVLITAYAEDDGTGEVLSVWDLERDVEVSFDSLPENERSQIEESAERLGYENAHEAYWESQISAAEAYRDSEEDR